jgi:segregation and condensation protein B
MSEQQTGGAPTREDERRPLAFPVQQAPALPPADLAAAVEALLFVAPEPVEAAELARALGVDATAVRSALETLAARREGGVRLQRDGARWQLVSAPEFGRQVERFLGAEDAGKLSTAALETLAIVAYQQPVTRAQIDAVRGVNSDRALTALRSRGLVEETGRAETVGRPALFGTTMRFLEYFGLEHPRDLPPLPDE